MLRSHKLDPDKMPYTHVPILGEEWCDVVWNEEKDPGMEHRGVLLTFISQDDCSSQISD